MTDTEVLKKAIEKATKQGWHWRLVDVRIPTITLTDGLIQSESGIFDIIFSHSFAKAFWGNEKIEVDRVYSTAQSSSEGTTGSIRKGDRVYSPVYKITWQYHLQQMVLEEHPISYLGRFV